MPFAYTLVERFLLPKCVKQFVDDPIAMIDNIFWHPGMSVWRNFSNGGNFWDFQWSEDPQKDHKGHFEPCKDSETHFIEIKRGGGEGEDGNYLRQYI